MSVLRIARRLILCIDIGFYHAGGRTGMIRRRLPRAFQQFHGQQFLENHATPILR